jgi:hypothetical protein
VAGTLIGLALSAMILTAVADFLKFYLAHPAGGGTRGAQGNSRSTATKVPGEEACWYALFSEKRPGRRDRSGSSRLILILEADPF